MFVHPGVEATWTVFSVEVPQVMPLNKLTHEWQTDARLLIERLQEHTVQKLGTNISQFAGQIQELQYTLKATNQFMKDVQQMKADKSDVHEISRKLGEIGSDVTDMRNSQRGFFDTIMSLYRPIELLSESPQPHV